MYMYIHMIFLIKSLRELEKWLIHIDCFIIVDNVITFSCIYTGMYIITG